MNRIAICLAAFVALPALITIDSRTDASASTGRVKANETHQTMEGFGASIAWYEDMLVGHPNKDEIYSYLFNDLGLDILRLRTRYVDNVIQNASAAAEIVNTLYERCSNEPKIMLSSWTPPYNLKSNNSQNGIGTLKKVDGQYVYGLFAKYWVDALNAYDAISITPAYITIQNEPDYPTTAWESCLFDATQNTTNAGYDRALDSVYVALQELQSPPKILGPEVLGIGYNRFQSYAQYFNRKHLDGYAYHLYHGESDNINDNHNPDLFIPNLSAIANSYTGKPIFQTEYDRGDWFNTVWLMHNCLVHGEVSGYLYWGLIWTASSGKGLITLEDPNYRPTWTTQKGYIIHTEYWAFRQYSKYIDSGWKRTTAEVEADSLRMSAFISPDGKNLTLVVLNIGTKADSMDFNIQDFNIANGQAVRTSATEDAEEITGSYDGKSVMEFPARSITTLSFSGDLVSAVEAEPSVPARFSLAQNYPNPFNPSTVISYGVARRGFVKLSVYDLLGCEVAVLVNEEKSPGRYTERWNPEHLPGGIYLCRLVIGKHSRTMKMVLTK